MCTWLKTFFLMVMFSLPCASCVTRSNSFVTERRFAELASLSDARISDLQILIYFARVCPDVQLADRALAGALSIIGLPSQRDIVFASNMTERDVKEIVSNASRRERQLDRAHVALDKSIQSSSRSVALMELISSLTSRLFWGALIFLVLFRLL